MALNLNQSRLAGNLTRDPELRYTPKGTAVTEIGIATNRRIKDGDQWKDEPTFLEVTFWAKQAETIAGHLSKGDPIYIEARLTVDQWDDKETGKKRSKLKLIGEHFQFVGTRQTQSPTQAPPPEPRQTHPTNEDLPSPF